MGANNPIRVESTTTYLKTSKLLKSLWCNFVRLFPERSKICKLFTKLSKATGEIFVRPQYRIYISRMRAGLNASSYR